MKSTANKILCGFSDALESTEYAGETLIVTELSATVYGDNDAEGVEWVIDKDTDGRFTLENGHWYLNLFGAECRSEYARGSIMVIADEIQSPALIDVEFNIALSTSTAMGFRLGFGF